MNTFKRRRLGLVIFLYLITGGLYGVYWIVRNGFAMYAADTRRRTAILPSVLLGTIVLFMSMVILAMRSVATNEVLQSAPQDFERFFLAAAFAAALIYLLAAVVSARIAKLICTYAGNRLGGVCSPVTAILLTFLGFTSAMYLQYHINRVLRTD